MTPEHFHILIPPGLGVVFALLSFADESLLKSKLSKMLDRHELAPKLAAGIERIVAGSVAVVTFQVNLLVFLINCIAGLVLFSGDIVDVFIVINVIFFLALVYQLLFLYQKLDLWDIYDLTRCGLFIGTWLKLEQLGFSILTIVYFGFGILKPSFHA